MPFYEFICDCGNEFEEMLSIKDDTVGVCPKCGKKTRKQHYSLGGFYFDFKEGFDYGLGEYCASARQRDNYAAEKGLKRLKVAG